MDLQLLHKPGSTMGEIKLDTSGRLQNNRRMLFVHYGRELPKNALPNTDLYHSPSNLPLESAASKAFEVIKDRHYDASEHAAGFTHPNTNTVMALYILEHPQADRWTQRKKNLLRNASIYSENLYLPEGTPEKEQAENLHHAINQLITELSGKFQREGDADGVRKLVEELVDGRACKELEKLFDDPSYKRYAEKRKATLARKQEHMRQNAVRTDHTVQLENGTEVNVTHFSSPRYYSTHARLLEAGETPHIVLGESSDGHRLIEIGAGLNQNGRKVFFPPAFWQALRQQEAANWLAEGKPLKPLMEDSPGGRENAGGTCRELDTLLTAGQVIALIRKHVEIRQPSKPMKAKPVK